MRSINSSQCVPGMFCTEPATLLTPWTGFLDPCSPTDSGSTIGNTPRQEIKHYNTKSNKHQNQLLLVEENLKINLK